MPPPVRTHVTLYRRKSTNTVELAGYAPATDVYVDAAVSRQRTFGGKTYYMVYLVGGSGVAKSKLELFITKQQAEDLPI